jgi:photosystem II stability/assembly factor-like uncharacterized protein
VSLYQSLLSFLLVWLATYSVGCEQNKRIRWENLPTIRSVAFQGPDAAWLVTERDGDLLFTTDGGKTWKQTTGRAIGSKFDAVTFVDRKHGWGVNHKGQIWKTEDGGESWIMISRLQPSGNADWQFNTAHDIKFVDGQTGWIIETFSIWRTIDGGTNWRKMFPSGANKLNGQPTRGYFPDSNSALVAATNGTVYRTTDRGENWETQTLLNNGDFNNVHFIDKDVGWLFGYVGGERGTQLYKTVNAGQTWNKHNFDEVRVESVYFLKVSEGWAVGTEPAPAGAKDPMRGVVFRTSDSGNTWKRIEVLADERSFDHIQFVDSQTGWLIGRNSIYRSDDAGKAWRPVLSLDSTNRQQ